MTIAIGMVCQDGVLVASDSMGSSGTVAHEVEKARALHRSPIVWAASGSSYMTQQIEMSIYQDYQKKNFKATPEKLADRLRPVLTEAYSIPTSHPGA